MYPDGASAIFLSLAILYFVTFYLLGNSVYTNFDTAVNILHIVLDRAENIVYQARNGAADGLLLLVQHEMIVQLGNAADVAVLVVVLEGELHLSMAVAFLLQVVVDRRP